MYQGDTINVFVTDDHEAVRFALESWIKTKASDEKPFIALLGTAASGKETLNALKTLRPDVLLIDMQLSDITGLEVIKTLRQQGRTNDD
ncbi:MAG: response regulator, partial [Candidatus Kapabacteria bacterium]|nr:response regulator [Candidatus Kapabacteria bacterium]